MQTRTAVDISPEACKRFKPFGVAHNSSVARQNSARDTAIKLAEVLKDRFGASRVMLFGSLVANDFNPWSDIDLAVWGVAVKDYFKAVAFVSGFSSIFRVDLVDADDCSPSLLENIKMYGVDL